MIKYAGIGARLTPMPVLVNMELIATLLASRGLMLRSGGAKGADTAFEVGCDLVKGRKVIRTPSYGGGTGPLQDRPWMVHAASFHPNWAACDDKARTNHARNSAVMLGDALDDPVKFVVCWTPGGAVVGGTGQALRIAAAHSIPVFNLALPGHDMGAVVTYVAGMGW